MRSQNNRLIGGVRWFPNGDRLIVGPRSLRGFLARGTYVAKLLLRAAYWLTPHAWRMAW